MPLTLEFILSVNTLDQTRVLSMNKKNIMDQTRKRKMFLRIRSDGDKEAYNNQRNYCVSFIRKTKQDYCNNLDHRKVPNNKSFLKSIKPLFSDKGSNFNKITLVENDSILEKNDDIAETFTARKVFK